MICSPSTMVAVGVGADDVRVAGGVVDLTGVSSFVGGLSRAMSTAMRATAAMATKAMSGQVHGLRLRGATAGAVEGAAGSSRVVASLGLP